MTFSNYKTAFGKQWKKIFYHDLPKSSLFNSFEEGMKCFEENKYSLLYSINDEHRINGYYEFLLEYPDFKGFNRWIQSS